jgi:hypothetical protein
LGSRRHVCRSSAAFFLRNGDQPTADDFEPVCMSALDEENLEVRFTGPYQAWPLFEVSQP